MIAWTYGDNVLDVVRCISWLKLVVSAIYFSPKMSPEFGLFLSCILSDGVSIWFFRWWWCYIYGCENINLVSR